MEISVIEKTIKKLPRGYRKTLALAVFGSADEPYQNKVKYWRKGAMKDQVTANRILAAAKQLAKQHN